MKAGVVRQFTSCVVGRFDLEAAFESLVVVVVRHADGERTAIEGGQDLREQSELVDAREVC
jgi:hypothetical protein